MPSDGGNPDAADAADAAPFDKSNLVLWLDAPNVTTTNNKVTTWTDKSGLGNDATQTDPAKQPVPATNVQNALPAVDFPDATGAILLVSKGAGFDDFTAGISVFIAAKPTAPFVQTYNPLVFLGTATATRNDAIELEQAGNANNDELGFYDGTGNVVANVFGNVANPNEFALYEAVLGAGALTIYKNGVSINTTATTSLPTKVQRPASSIGGAVGLDSIGYAPFVGLIGEIMVFKIGFDDTGRKAVEGYLKTKWNL